MHVKCTNCHCQQQWSSFNKSIFTGTQHWSVSRGNGQWLNYYSDVVALKWR